jgi:FAD-dependent urate hydroxylase
VHSTDVAVIGAGPYGLSAATSLRKAGLAVWILGRPMSFWREHMPENMLLRSVWDACSIESPQGAGSLDAYVRETGATVPRPVPLGDFVGYGEWFARRCAGEIDEHEVSEVVRSRDGFRLMVADGSELTARRVIVAAGIAPFAFRPAAFDHLSPTIVSHSAEHRTFSPFRGRVVAVLGGGQSALESAALLAEAGAHVKVITRADRINWLRRDQLGPVLARLRPLLYTREDVGPPGLNRIAASPNLFRLLPRRLQSSVAARSIRPAGASWLIGRLQGVPFHIGRTVASAAETNGRLALRLDDDERLEVDHLLLATGFRVDVSRYRFLTSEVLSRVERVGGYPRLVHGFESTCRGLHFVGAPAAFSFGPLMRFVSGTWFAAGALARALAP